MTKTISVLCFLMWTMGPCEVRTSEMSSLGEVSEPLFYIERNVDDRRVHYSLNLDDSGQLVRNKPFDVFWVSNDGNGQRSSLNFVQRRFVYGIRTVENTPEEIVFHIAAYKELPLYLRRRNGNHQVFVQIDSVWCVLQRVYVELRDENVINPEVVFVLIEGVDPQGRKRKQKIVN